MDGDTGRSGRPVWFGGGKLAPDLTLPKLRQRWAGSAPVSDLPSPAERAAAWGRVLRAVDTATAHIRQMASGDPVAAADAAWAASGTMHAAAALLGSRVLREAADAYDRAARAPYARVPAPTQAGSSLRAAARLLSQWTDYKAPAAPARAPVPDDGPVVAGVVVTDPVRLAAQGFPCSAADAIRAGGRAGSAQSRVQAPGAGQRRFQARSPRLSVCWRPLICPQNMIYASGRCAALVVTERD